MGWFLVRTLVWSWISRTSGKYEVYEGMYWFIGISRVSGLLDSLKMSRQSEMLLGVRILVIFLVEYILL